MTQLTVTRGKIARKIKHNTGISIKKAEEIFNAILEVISSALQQEKVVTIRRFGSLSCRHKAQRLGRNPKTLQEAIIRARKVVRFKVATTLKNRINANINVKSQ
jgi:integration host factor subunit alpha